jgi:hypothetical protein
VILSSIPWRTRRDHALRHKKLETDPGKGNAPTAMDDRMVAGDRKIAKKTVLPNGYNKYHAYRTLSREKERTFAKR